MYPPGYNPHGQMGFAPPGQAPYDFVELPPGVAAPTGMQGYPGYQTASYGYATEDLPPGTY